jgi:hypothetical protein
VNVCTVSLPQHRRTFRKRSCSEAGDPAMPSPQGICHFCPDFHWDLQLLVYCWSVHAQFKLFKDVKGQMT